ncbi:hypothetical protein HK104_007906, partial [Borealophlyctis nickersoniae]
EVDGWKGLVRFEVEGKGLDKKDLWGKSDPYFRISRKEGDTYTQIYQSNHIPKTLDPAWGPKQIRLIHLCGPSLSRSTQLLIQVFDYDLLKKHDLIGQFSTTPDELVKSAGREFELVNPSKVNKWGYRNSGRLRVV